MKRFVVALAAWAGMSCALAQEVEVKDIWVRATVPGQSATGAFMNLRSRAGARLEGGASPIAGVVEVHEMKIDDQQVMRMKAVPAIELPAGQTVALKPGGYHVMLMDLKQPLKAGDTVPVTLTVEGADGKRETVEVKAPVEALGAEHKQH